MEYLISLFLSILGNLLTPATKKVFRWPAEPNSPAHLPLTNLEELPIATERGKEEIRAYNRQQLEQIGRLIWIHGFTFMCLFVAFYLPLLWKSMPATDVEFAATRLAVLSQKLAFKHEHIGTTSLLFALMMYLPIWFLSQTVGHFIATVWDHLNKVSPTRYASLVALSFIALAFLIAGHWAYLLFPQNSYVYSVTFPFVAVGLFGYLSSSRR